MKRRKNPFPLSGLELRLPGRPARSLVAVPTDLFRLLTVLSKPVVKVFVIYAPHLT
jgi:hypothetical protein